MKVKTSISLSEDIVQALEAHTAGGNRSEFIEQALKYYFSTLRRRTRDIHDLEIIDGNAERLNEEADDTLGYQDNR